MILRRSTVALVGVAVALLVWVVLVESGRETTLDRRRSELMLVDFPEASIRSVSLQMATEQWKLEKADSAWRASGQRTLEARVEPVQQVIEIVSRIGRIGELPAETEAVDVGLDPPLGRLVIDSSEGRRELEIGRQVVGTEGWAVRVVGQEQLLVASGGLGTLFEFRFDDFRSRRPLAALLGDLAGIEIQRPGRADLLLAFRSGAWWVSAGDEPADLAEQDLVREFLLACEDFEVERFEGENVAPVGPDWVHLRFETADGSRSEVAIEPSRGLAGPAEGLSRMQLDGEMMVAAFRLPLAALDYPRSFAVGGGLDLPAHRIRLRRGDLQVEIRAEGPSWVDSRRRPVPTERVQDVRRLLSRARGIAFLDRASAPGHGLRPDHPDFLVEFEAEDGTTRRFELMAGAGKFGAVAFDLRPSLVVLENERFAAVADAIHRLMLGAAGAAERE